MVKEKISIPLIAAGGIATGKAMLAAMTLGADGVQIGSRFVASHESSAHANFKKTVIEINEGDTILTLKELTPVRMIKNAFYKQLETAYSNGTNAEELTTLLGRGRAKKGMYEGDLIEGELEIGQIAGLIKHIQPAREIVAEIIQEYQSAIEEMKLAKFQF